MWLTLVVIVIDTLILLANGIPYLPWHSLYLIYLTIRLNRVHQPTTYTQPISTLSPFQFQSLPKCSKCLNNPPKPSRYYHCRHCNTCIYRLDHHCNFVDNCIGQYNFKMYVHLLVNAWIHAVVVMLVMGWEWKGIIGLEGVRGLYWIIVIPAGFAVYQSARLIQACHLTVNKNQTLIQSYKQVRGIKQPYLSTLTSYLGPPSIKWFLPTFIPSDPPLCNLLEPTFPLNKNQEVKQYDYADQYIYGGDDQDDQLYMEYEEEKNKEEKNEKKE